ncbi:MAG: glycoside hydrolase domain-containing protein, partial [bacterium]
MKLRFNYWLWVGCVFGLLATMFAVSACADAVPAAAAPLVVWTDTPWQTLKPDLKPPTNPSQSIKLAAARGGIASGLVLVSGAGGAVQAKAEELKGPGGAIPVRIRYATRKRDLGPTTWGEINGRKLDGSYNINGSTNLEALSDTPVADEPLQAVWVTVDVPPDTKAGNYQGNLTVEGKTIDIALSVSDFTIPPLGKRQLYVNIHQSPDSVAFRYNVKPWSDEHFKLLEPSLDLAGRAGTNILYVPVIGFTYFGQRNGLIVFTRKGEELVPDFTAFDRYLDLWIKHVGKPQLVVLNVWDVYLAGWNPYQRNYLTRQFPIDANTLEVTVREADGTLKQVRTPLYDKAPDTWKALVEGVQQRMAKVGMAKHQIMLGQASDAQVPKATVDFFKTLDPDLRWTAWTHGYGYGGDYGTNGNRMGLMTFPDFHANLSYPRGLPIAPGPNTRINLDALRMYLDERQDSSILRWRVVPDLSGGYGPVGLDLWPLAPFVPTDEEKKSGRFRQGGAWSLKLDYGANLDRGQIALCTVAGPNGALSTTRLEGLAEGACETEARYCVELAARLRQIDVETAKSVINARYSALNVKVTDPKTGKESVYCDIYGSTPAPANWNESLAALYDLAGKARQALDDPAVLTKIPAVLPKLYDEHDLGPQLFAFRYMVDHLPQA